MRVDFDGSRGLVWDSKNGRKMKDRWRERDHIGSGLGEK